MYKIFAILLLLSSFLLNTKAQNLIEGTKNQVIWAKNNTSDTELNLSFSTKVKPKSMIIGYDSPNGIKFRIYFKNIDVAVDLRYIIDMKKGLNEWDDLMKGYYVQIATHDFDNDKNPEIIIAIGDGLGNMWVNVVKYSSPLKPADAINTENWKVVASFDGNKQIAIKDNTISVYSDNNSILKKYSWKTGKFIETY